MKKILFLLTIIISVNANAKIWRVNNTAGVNADFTSLATAVANISVIDGDTIHVEPSATVHSGIIITKNLIIIGNGYFLAGTGSNPGLQENTETSKLNNVTFANGSAGVRMLGLEYNGSLVFAGGYSGVVNINFEKCRFDNFITFSSSLTYTGISFRKCFFSNGITASPGTLNDFTMEGCIFASPVFGGINLTPTNGTNITIRNNVIAAVFSNNFSNAYFANNLVFSGSNDIFTNCNVKNNIFSFNQTGVSVGPLSTNGNNLISQPIASVVLNTGSNDGKFQLAGGSPAIGGGVNISGTKPDCGAFGSTDPYKLSGIPGIPTIYSLTVPASVPLGSPTMNVTFSTRNNN